MLSTPDQPRYGYELGAAIGFLGGVSRVYVFLGALQARGWVESSFEERASGGPGNPRRRVYRLTDAGRADGAEALRMLRDDLATLIVELTPHPTTSQVRSTP